MGSSVPPVAAEDPVAAYLRKYGKAESPAGSGGAPPPDDPVARYLAKYKQAPATTTPGPSRGDIDLRTPTGATAAAAPVAPPPAPKPIDHVALAREQREVSAPAAGRDVTQVPITSDAVPAAQRQHFPEPVRSVLQYGVDPMLESPLQSTLLAATGPVGGAIGAASMAYDVGKYGVQKARESQMAPEERARALADPNRIPGKQAAVEAGMLGLPLVAHVAGRALGRALDVSGGMMEEGTHAIAPMTESRASAVVPLERETPVAPAADETPRNVVQPSETSAPPELPPEAADYLDKWKPPAPAAAAESPNAVEQPAHEFSSTQVNLPAHLGDKIRQLGENIPDADLAADARETDPHVTVKYGLHGEDPAAVRELLANEPPVAVRLGKSSFFPNGESGSGDVLKLDVDSPDLHRLNKKIADAVPHTDTHPEYKPHATIAYVKPGLGEKYAGDASLEGHTALIDRVVFSGKNGEKVEIPLGGQRPAAKPGSVVDEDGFERFQDPRTAAGGRRPVARVSNDGLIRELADLEPKRVDAQLRSVYEHRQDDDFHSTEDGRTVIAATRQGKGPSMQAKALQNLADYQRMTDELHAELERRGLQPQDIYERVTEQLHEREGMAGEEERGGAFDDQHQVRDESGKVLFAPAAEGEDLFGNTPTEAQVGNAAQETLFGGKEGSESTRSTSGTERAARAELEKLRTMQPLLKDPRAVQRASARIAELEKLVNRDRAISADEMATRARAQSGPDETPIGFAAAKPIEEEGPAPGQGALFSPAAPGTPLSAKIRKLTGRTPSTTPVQVKSLATISRALADMVGVPLRQGRFKAAQLRARGVFFPDKEVARLIRFDHLDTAAHEVGHYVSQEYLKNPTMRGAGARGVPPLTMAMKRELVKMGKDLYGSRKPTGGYGEEGIAQWARFYVTEPARLATDAPTFTSWMEQHVLAKEPALKAALAQSQRDFADYVKAPATARVDAMLDVKPSRRFLPDPRTLATAMLDDLNEVRLAVEEIGGHPSPTENAYTLARLTRGAAGIAEEMIEHGVVDWRGQRTTRGLAEVLRELKPEDVQPFRRYLIAERTLEVAKRGVDTGVSVQDAQEMVRLYGNKFRQPAQELWSISNALIDYRRDHGLLTSQEAQHIRERNQKRVGFYRVFDDDERAAGSGGIGRGFGRNSSGVQAMRGSARTIIDPLESMITDHYKTVKQAKSAEVLRVLVQHAEQTGGAGHVVEVLFETPQEKVTIPVNERTLRQLEELGYDVTENPTKPLGAGVLEAFQDRTTASARETKDLVRPLVINGERKWIQLKDAKLYDALAGLGTPEMPTWLRWMSVPTRTLRAGATLTLEFIGRNPARDAWTAAIRSQAGFRPPGWDFARGMFHVLKQDELYQRWKLAGADNAAMLGLDRPTVQKHLRQLTRSPAARAAGWVIHPIDTLRMLSSLMENATRVGEYAGVEQRAVTRGASARGAQLEAGLAARNVTVDFAKSGAQLRIVNQLMAFANANVQGVTNMLGDFKTRPEVVLPRILATITLPSVGLYLLQRDDPAYQEVPAWQKAVAWVIVQRDHTTGEVSHIWRIPKPPEFGILFGSVPERVLDWIHTQDPKGLDKLTQAFSSLNPVHWPDALTPLIEWWANKSTFTGRPIVPEGAQSLPAGEQATSRTGEAARTIGGALNVSPAKVENTVRGYGAGLGQYGIEAANAGVRAMRSLTGQEPLPTPAQHEQRQLADLPFARGFMMREPGLEAQTVQDALDTFSENEAHRQAWRHRKAAGDRAGADQYFQEHEEAIRSVSTPEDHLGKPGPLRLAHDLIVDAQKVSKDADDATRRQAADAAIEAARQALGGEGLSKHDSRQLRRPLRDKAAESRRNLRAP